MNQTHSKGLRLFGNGPPQNPADQIIDFYITVKISRE